MPTRFYGHTQSLPVRCGAVLEPAGSPGAAGLLQLMPEPPTKGLLAAKLTAAAAGLLPSRSRLLLPLLAHPLAWDDAGTGRESLVPEGPNSDAEDHSGKLWAWQCLAGTSQKLLKAMSAVAGVWTLWKSVFKFLLGDEAPWLVLTRPSLCTGAVESPGTRGVDKHSSYQKLQIEEKQA
uniref:Uncharacterized protein n=1 Tax=Sphaerodactylus townsendi TaxID=933632 RepID=A0ACB8FJQ9_9SAUR